MKCLESIKSCLAFHSRDWFVNSRDAWLYGIVHGWDDETLAEAQVKFGWTPETVARIKRLHKEFESACTGGPLVIEQEITILPSRKEPNA